MKFLQFYSLPSPTDTVVTFGCCPFAVLLVLSLWGFALLYSPLGFQFINEGSGALFKEIKKSWIALVEGPSLQPKLVPKKKSLRFRAIFAFRFGQLRWTNLPSCVSNLALESPQPVRRLRSIWNRRRIDLNLCRKVHIALFEHGLFSPNNFFEWIWIFSNLRYELR